MTRHGHQYLVQRVLSLRANFSAYDAAYAALAEALGASMVTVDERFANAIRDHLDLRVQTAGLSA